MTCDVARCGRATYGAALTPNGKIVVDAFVAALDGDATRGTGEYVLDVDAAKMDEVRCRRVISRDARADDGRGLTDERGRVDGDDRR